MQLHGRKDELEARGVQLYLVGNGSPHYIDGFREITGYTGDIFTDPSLKVFKSAGMIRGLAATFGIRSIKSGFKSMRAGYRQGRTQGDALQQGGALLVSTAGQVLWTHHSQSGGDNVSVDTLLEACGQLGG